MSTAATDFPYPLTLGEPDAGDDLIGDAGDAGEGDGAPATSEDRLAEMQARLEAMEQAAQQRETFYQNMLARQANPQTAVPEADLTLDDLPDPVENIAEFRKQLSSKLKDYTTRTAQRAADDVRTQTSQTQAFNDVWARFRTEHADLASKNVLLRAAAMAEIEDLQGRGVDPATAIQRDSDGFITRVADRMRAELGDSPAPNRPTSGRTKGASGGSRAAGKGGGGASKPASFADQLRKRQAEFGLI